MKVLYLKGYNWLLSQNQRVRTDFLVIDGTRHWLNISNRFLKSIKVKGHQRPDYDVSTTVGFSTLDFTA